MESVHDDPSARASSVVNFSLLNPCKGPEDIKAPNLKCLYSLLSQISLHPSFDKHYVKDGSSFDVLNNRYKVQVAAVDITSLSELLFIHLHQHFEMVFSSVNSEQSHYNSNILSPQEDLIFLLKCCMVILPYTGFDEYLVSERRECLIKILERSCSQENEIRSNKFNSSICDDSFHLDLGDLDISFCSRLQTCSPASYLCSILEVFINEILVNRHVREYFKKLECGFPPIVLEAISAHFLLSMSAYGALSRFLHCLFCPCCTSYGLSTLSLTAALSMLGIYVIYTAPYLLQAHAVLLLSNCIWIPVNLDNERSIPLCLDNYISAFENSIDMYNLRISSLKIDCHLIGIKSEVSLGFMEPYLWKTGCQSDFSFCIKSTMHRKIENQIGSLVYSYQTFSHDISSTAKFDVLSTSTAYIQEISHILDESCRDNISMTLKCIIEQTLSNEVRTDTTCKKGDLCQQELFLLAAVLKLMGCTLLKIVEYMKHIRSICGLQILIDDACKKFDSIIKIIGCFELYELTQPIQKILLDVMETCATSCKEIRLILVHFVGVLVFAFDSGHDFLWKGCIFMLMTVMNLLLFEEGNLDSITLFLSREKESSSKLCSVEVQMGQTCRQSSQRIASNFEKVRRMHTKEKQYKTFPQKSNSAESQNIGLQNSGNTISDVDEERWENGEAYLRSIGETSDCADLIDFLACKKGKDYSTWIENRAKYRKWRSGKLAAYRRAVRRVSFL